MPEEPFFSHCSVGPRELPSNISIVDLLLTLWATILPRLIDEINNILFRTHVRETLSQLSFRVKPVTTEMFLAFLGIWLHMGLNRRSNTREYWNSATRNKWISSIGGCFVTFFQWTAIFAALYHLSDDFLDWMETELNCVFTQHWCCARKVSIDEVMKQFKGRSKHKVYEPSKPTKWGLKYYALVDRLGYLFRFQMHQNGVKVTLVDLCTDFLSSLDKESGTRLFGCDNYYGKIELAEWCTQNNLWAVMTMRSNRPTYFWNDVQSHAKKSWDHVGAIVVATRADGISAYAWKDRAVKKTLFLTNIPTATTDVDMIKTTRRKGGRKMERWIPTIAYIYKVKSQKVC